MKRIVVSLAASLMASIYVTPAMAQERAEKIKANRSLVTTLTEATRELLELDSPCGKFDLLIECPPEPSPALPCGPGGLGSCNPIDKRHK